MHGEMVNADVSFDSACKGAVADRGTSMLETMGRGRIPMTRRCSVPQLCHLAMRSLPGPAVALLKQFSALSPEYLVLLKMKVGASRIALEPSDPPVQLLL